jgi:hypothetical protein
MNPLHSRRSFISTSASFAAASLFTITTFAQETQPLPPGVPKAPAKPPALSPQKVEAVVSVAHRSLEKVRELVEEYPLLANACWDWGGGDFETPLQAAAHTGRREIAEYLLGKNARFDLYAAAMLGELDQVKALLAPNPVLLAAVRGPHGFTLFPCAKQGGDKARPVVNWLIASGIPDTSKRPLPFTWPAGAPAS